MQNFLDLYQKHFHNWTFMRIIKLLMALYIGFEAIANQQYVLLLLAAFFLYQSIFNVSCLGANGCSVNQNSKTKA